ncbi:MAG: hypothetical protein P8X61_06785 [Limibacillus sp.]
MKDEDRVEQVALDPLRRARRGKGNQVKREGRRDGHGEIDPRPRRRDQDRIASGVTQPREGDGHRLGPSEDQREAQQDQEARYHDGAEKVDMAERIEADAVLPLGRIVAQFPGDIAVSGLVQGDGEDKGQHPRGDGQQRQRCLILVHLVTSLGLRA